MDIDEDYRNAFPHEIFQGQRENRREFIQEFIFDPLFKAIGGVIIHNPKVKQKIRDELLPELEGISTNHLEKNRNFIFASFKSILAEGAVFNTVINVSEDKITRMKQVAQDVYNSGESASAKWAREQREFFTRIKEENNKLREERKKRLNASDAETISSPASTPSKSKRPKRGDGSPKIG